MTIDLRERSAPLLDAMPSRVVTRSVAPRERAVTPRQHGVIALVALSSLGAALFSDASPAGIALADALYRAAFAGSVVWFAARSRRWTWPLLAGAAVLATASLLGQILCIVSLGVAARSVRRRRRDRFVGAGVAAVCVPALLSQGVGPVWRLTDGHIQDPFATSALITLAATLPVLRSGWLTLSRRRRQMIWRTARQLSVAVAVVLLVTVGASAFAFPSMLRGLDSNRAATASANAGDLEEASAEFDAAADEWADANRYLSGPWMVPGRLIPVVGQHVRAAQVVSGQASAMSSAAAAASARIRPDALIVDGAVDIEEVDSIAPAVDALAATATRATARIDAVRSPWLIPAVATRVDRAVELLGRTSGLATASAEALHVGADVLGGDSPAQILVMVSTPAEARGAGGFVGNWALLESTDGRVSLKAQYHSRELNDLLAENDAVLIADDDYLSRYERFTVERHIQDVTLSPDFPSVAPVAADLFEQATEQRVDAVLLIDPFVIEKLVGFTGPLDIDQVAPLTGGNAAKTLLVDQYIDFADDEREREARLLALTDQLIDALFDSPPDPIAFATELAPLAEQNRISLWLAEDEDGSIVERLGLSGSFQNDGEILAVVHQNGAQNKIDPYLERTIDIRSLIHPETRQIEHDVTITLDNTAPSSGLPDAVLSSNDQGLLLGTNRLTLSVYSAQPLVAARIDGETAAVEVASEFGLSVYSFVLAIGPGDFSTVQLEFAGPIHDASSYDITLAAQPLSSPDRVSWRMSTDDGSQIAPPDGWTHRPDGVRWAALLQRTEDFQFVLDR